jgi:hypothetical protein
VADLGRLGNRRLFLRRHGGDEDGPWRRGGGVRLDVFAVVVDEVAFVDQEDQLAPREAPRRVEFARHGGPLDARGVDPDRLERLGLADHLDRALAQETLGAEDEVDRGYGTFLQLSCQGPKFHGFILLDQSRAS